MLWLRLSFINEFMEKSYTCHWELPSRLFAGGWGRKWRASSSSLSRSPFILHTHQEQGTHLPLPRVPYSLFSPAGNPHPADPDQKHEETEIEQRLTPSKKPNPAPCSLALDFHITEQISPNQVSTYNFSLNSILFFFQRFLLGFDLPTIGVGIFNIFLIISRRGEDHV